MRKILRERKKRKHLPKESENIARARAQAQGKNNK